MGLYNWFKERFNGKFEWADLLSLSGTINSITGNNWFPDNPLRNDEFFEQHDDINDYIRDTEQIYKNGVEEAGGVGNFIIDTMTNEGQATQTQAEKDINETLKNGADKIEDGIEYITGEEVQIAGKEPQNEIKDETDANLGTKNIDYLTWADEKIKEQQEREDTAYQRAVADMKKAGINPNLMNVQPASSSAGSVSGMDGISAMLEELDTYLTNETKIDEGTKDRLTSLFGNILMAILFKKIK